MWTVPACPRPGWADYLDDDERCRLAMLENAAARDLFLASRAVQRIIGAHYLGIAPRRVAIVRTCEHCDHPRHGRPRFGAGGVEYSLSHTADWLRVAVVGGGERVGLDLEETGSLHAVPGLARIIFGAQELADFERARAALRTGLLLRAWTRKEAAMKVTGFGLQLNPAFVDVRGERARVSGPLRWPGPIHLRDLPAPHGHACAVACTAPLTRVLER
ncbi:MAG TPA: 4'-phosphopantetheinyl transferase superfamily protein [Actinocrinis sp.]|nr:4'-phosphopantetheinyl transferase superfamily protein [Actinocrinis sp.]